MSCILIHILHFSLFFFNDTATTEIYTLSLHDALPISTCAQFPPAWGNRLTSEISQVFKECRNKPTAEIIPLSVELPGRDRKSTRLNSSHVEISYAVFCLKKKKKKQK